MPLPDSTPIFELKPIASTGGALADSTPLAVGGKQPPPSPAGQRARPRLPAYAVIAASVGASLVAVGIVLLAVFAMARQRRGHGQQQPASPTAAMEVDMPQGRLAWRLLKGTPRKDAYAESLSGGSSPRSPTVLLDESRTSSRFARLNPGRSRVFDSLFQD